MSQGDARRRASHKHHPAGHKKGQGVHKLDKIQETWKGHAQPFSISRKAGSSSGGAKLEGRKARGSREKGR